MAPCLRATQPGHSPVCSALLTRLQGNPGWTSFEILLELHSVYPRQPLWYADTFEESSWLIYQPIPSSPSKFNPEAAQFQLSCQYNIKRSAALLTFPYIMGSSLICNETLWINQCMLIYEVFNILWRTPWKSNSQVCWKSLWKFLSCLYCDRRKMFCLKEK